jgi:uncharacterized protein (DUF433 family)
MSQPRSFRLSDTVLASLRERARERGESANSLVERYLEEGLRRDDHPLIVFREGAAGRRAALVGTRLDVAQVIDTLRESKNSIDATAEYLEIPEQHARAAVQYYSDFRDEVDEWRERARAIAEREEDAWRREQSVLA